MEKNELLAKVESALEILNSIKAELTGTEGNGGNAANNGNNSDELWNKIISVLSSEFECEADVMKPEAVIKDTLELDSLSLVDLKALLSDEFDVDVPNQDFFQIKTFQNLYDYLKANSPKA